MLTESLNQGILLLSDIAALDDNIQHIRDCVDNTPASFFVEFHRDNTNDCLALLLARLWDGASDTHSIINTAKRAERRADVLINRHVERFGEIFPDFESACRKLCERQVESFLGRVRRVEEGAYSDFIKLHRDENLAHLLNGRSRLRKRLKDAGREDVLGLSPSLGEILDFAEFSFSTIMDFRFIWKWELSQFQSKIELYKRVHSAFWQSLGRCHAKVEERVMHGTIVPRTRGDEVDDF